MITQIIYEITQILLLVCNQSNLFEIGVINYRR